MLNLSRYTETGKLPVMHIVTEQVLHFITYTVGTLFMEIGIHDPFLDKHFGSPDIDLVGLLSRVFEMYKEL